MRHQTGNVSLEAEHTMPALNANYMSVSHSLTEFVIDFGLIYPQEPGAGGSLKADWLSRITVNPILIKSFLNAIKDNIEKHEILIKGFLPENPGDIIKEVEANA